MRARSVVTLVVSLFMIALPAVGEADESMDKRTGGAIAEFEGELIDLSEGWGKAGACVVWETDELAKCFRTESELLERFGEFEQLTGTGAPLATCSSSLRLYDGLGYTGAVLYLYQRTTWINLSSYGFSNRTSSYKVGSCSAYFADGSNGGGDWYPTHLTQAWDKASGMISGWSNRVSSVYIN